MPFTPSHAIVALPFAGSRTLAAAGIPAAIAVGAITPDLPLFVRGTPISYEWTHSFAWLPLTGLLAFVLLLVWRCVLRPAARELAPRWLARRLPGEWDAAAAAAAVETVAPRAWRDLPARPLFPAVLAAALLFGIVTHIAWDLFTHEGRAAIPLLEASWGPLPGYRWLQHGSSVVGLVILAVWAVVWVRGADAAAGPATPEAPRRPSALRGGGGRTIPSLLPATVRWGWWLALPTLLVVAAVAGYAARGPFTEEFTPQHLAYQVLPPACAVWGVLTLVLCVVVQARRARHSRA